MGGRKEIAKIKGTAGHIDVKITKYTPDALESLVNKTDYTVHQGGSSRTHDNKEAAFKDAIKSSGHKK
jgi:hypothetical protein